MYYIILMKYIIPLFLLSVFLIPLAQSSYAQQLQLQQQYEIPVFLPQVLPKVQNLNTLNTKVQDVKNNTATAKQDLQNLTQTLDTKVQDVKNKTISELNQAPPIVKRFFFNNILPKIQNLTQTLDTKVQNLNNTATPELNQAPPAAKKFFFNNILPKIQNLTHTLNIKVQNFNNTATPELNQADKSLSQGINSTKSSIGQILNKIIPNSY
jgi:molecular chaperone GrpE (heat shock protein)